MNENTKNQPKNDNEIDLIELCTRICGSMKKIIIQIFNYFLKLIKFIFRLISWNIRFVLRNIIWFILVIFIAIASAYFISNRKIINKREAGIGVVIRTRVLSVQELRPYLESFNQYIKSKDPEDLKFLSRVTGVSENILQKIAVVNIYYFLNFDGEIKVDFNNNAESLLKEERIRVESEYALNKSKAKDPSKVEKGLYKVDLNEEGLYLEMFLNSKDESLSKFDLASMMIRYVDSIPEYQKELELKYKFTAEKKDRIDKEIHWLDTLRTSELKRMETATSSDGNTTTVIIDQKESLEKDYYSFIKSDQSLKLFDEKQDLEKSLFYKDAPIIRSLSLTKNTINVIGGSQDEGFSFVELGFVFSIIAAFICYLTLLIIFFRKKIVKELKKDLYEF